jgi:RNA polymerase primary sigma factor
LSQAIEERYEQVRHLLALGKERGYLLFDEVNDILPAEVHSPEEIDDLLATFERYGIDIYEDVTVAKAARASQESSEVHEDDAPELAETGATSDDLELDLAPGVVVSLSCRSSASFRPRSARS